MGIKKTLRGLVNKKEKSVPTETENGLAIQQIADADLFPIVKIPEISRPSQNLCKPPMWCRIEAPHWRFL